MYNKATQYTPNIDARTRTTLMQVLNNIGETLVAQSNLVAAAAWFRRAAAESSTSRGDRYPIPPEAELPVHEQTRLAALRSLVQCLVGLKSRETLHEASSIVRTAQAEFGDRRVEVLEMMVLVQAAKGDAADALTDLLVVLLP